MGEIDPRFIRVVKNFYIQTILPKIKKKELEFIPNEQGPPDLRVVKTGKTISFDAVHRLLCMIKLKDVAE